MDEKFLEHFERTSTRMASGLVGSSVCFILIVLSLVLMHDYPLEMKGLFMLLVTLSGASTVMTAWQQRALNIVVKEILRLRRAEEAKGTESLS